MTTEATLESETKKWLKVLEERVSKEEIKNTKAYIHDSKHFLDKKDFVRAFEAVMYAYGIYEACFRMGLVQEEK